jgi:hypothetical protein
MGGWGDGKCGECEECEECVDAQAASRKGGV